MEVPDLLEPRSSKDGVLFIGVTEKPSGEEEKELDTGRATEKTQTNTFKKKNAANGMLSETECTSHY